MSGTSGLSPCSPPTTAPSRSQRPQKTGTRPSERPSLYDFWGAERLKIDLQMCLWCGGTQVVLSGVVRCVRAACLGCSRHCLLKALFRPLRRLPLPRPRNPHRSRDARHRRLHRDGPQGRGERTRPRARAHEANDRSAQGSSSRAGSTRPLRKGLRQAFTDGPVASCFRLRGEQDTHEHEQGSPTFSDGGRKFQNQVLSLAVGPWELHKTCLHLTARTPPPMRSRVVWQKSSSAQFDMARKFQNQAQFLAGDQPGSATTHVLTSLPEHHHRLHHRLQPQQTLSA